jgi:hypothetical protein
VNGTGKLTSTPQTPMAEHPCIGARIRCYERVESLLRLRRLRTTECEVGVALPLTFNVAGNRESVDVSRWDEKAGLGTGCDTLPSYRRA